MIIDLVNHFKLNMAYIYSMFIFYKYTKSFVLLFAFITYINLKVFLRITNFDIYKWFYYTVVYFINFSIIFIYAVSNDPKSKCVCVCVHIYVHTHTHIPTYMKNDTIQAKTYNSF